MEERAKALALLMFLKEMRNKSVKARMCTNGREQRGHLAKQDTTLPAVSTETVFITVLIKASRGM